MDLPAYATGTSPSPIPAIQCQNKFPERLAPHLEDPSCTLRNNGHFLQQLAVTQPLRGRTAHEEYEDGPLAEVNLNSMAGHC